LCLLKINASSLDSKVAALPAAPGMTMKGFGQASKAYPAFAVPPFVILKRSGFPKKRSFWGEGLRRIRESWALALKTKRHGNPPTLPKNRIFYYFLLIPERKKLWLVKKKL
jgi:hypothetical protein